ncbi:MAG: helix-turn-helix domain-containing protein [Candidatus Omnitrophica bacterium]|nr:helix-turn-helix domain-containing protein [Candidatus Omnitrophota bacterium]
MEKLLTVDQLSDILQVSRRTIYDWTHTGFVPHYKLPKGVRFKIVEIEQWLQKRKEKGRCFYKVTIRNDWV